MHFLATCHSLTTPSRAVAAADYKANSNLVLTAEQRTSAGREPDGSAESLWGRLKGSMGDRVARERPEGLQKKPAKKREAGGAEGDYDMPKRRKVGPGRVCAGCVCGIPAGARGGSCMPPLLLLLLVLVHVGSAHGGQSLD